MAISTLAQSVSMITDPCVHCVAKRTPSAHAFASASAALAQRNIARHAVKITSPLWFFAITPTPAPPVCSTNEPSILTLVQRSCGGVQLSSLLASSLLPDPLQCSFPFLDVISSFLPVHKTHACLIEKRLNQLVETNLIDV